MKSINIKLRNGRIVTPKVSDARELGYLEINPQPAKSFEDFICDNSKRKNIKRGR